MDEHRLIIGIIGFSVVICLIFMWAEIQDLKHRVWLLEFENNKLKEK